MRGDYLLHLTIPFGRILSMRGNCRVFVDAICTETCNRRAIAPTPHAFFLCGNITLKRNRHVLLTNLHTF